MSEKERLILAAMRKLDLIITDENQPIISEIQGLLYEALYETTD